MVVVDTKTTTAKENRGNVTRANKNSSGMKRGKRKLLVAVDTKTTTAEENRGNVTRAN